VIKAVIIDLDDTLCLTEAACFDMENEVLVKMGLQPMSRDIHVSSWGKPLFEAIQIRSPGLNLDMFKQIYAPTIKEYTNSGKLDSIPPENLKALDELIDMNKTICILTSRTHGELKHLLKPDHSLSQRVKTFYYRDNMQYHKPDPRAFNEFFEHYKLEPSETIYVGDSTSDAVAAKEAGLHFIASLESGLRSKKDFSQLSVDGYIDKFYQIVQAVKSLEGITS
jgi:HAD superfamily hydrolase (TIGR01549 family)